MVSRFTTEVAYFSGHPRPPYIILSRFRDKDLSKKANSENILGKILGTFENAGPAGPSVLVKEF